jgi:hypothetical protein
MAQESLNDEIKWLEERLSAKKTELLEKEQSAAGGVIESKEEREMARDVIKEAASQNLLPVPSGSQISDDDAKKAALLLDEKEHDEIVSDLVAIAFSKGMAHAMKAANALKNPHILDEFHDALADKYYQKLLESKKIK